LHRIHELSPAKPKRLLGCRIAQDSRAESGKAETAVGTPLCLDIVSRFRQDWNGHPESPFLPEFLRRDTVYTEEKGGAYAEHVYAAGQNPAQG